jgi:hypothetical protein
MSQNEVNLALLGPFQSQAPAKITSSPPLYDPAMSRQLIAHLTQH